MSDGKKDVEMADAATTSDVSKEAPTMESSTLFLSDLKKQNLLLERAVSGSDSRLVNRVLRSLGTTKRKLTINVLKSFIEHSLETEEVLKNQILSQLSSVPDENSSNQMDISSETTSVGQPNGSVVEGAQATKVVKPLLPEVEIYVRLLVIVFLIDKKHYQEAQKSAIETVQRLEEFNRRTLNPLSAKVFFYYARTFELLGQLEDIRSNLLAFHRTAILRHNDEAEVTLLNLILRNYLQYNLYDQADKFVSKAQFKEEAASNEEFARYLYYQGKIKSVQLDYADAYSNLQGAMRKAPQNSARGFRLAVTKLACIVQCLIGEIPERSLFRQPGLKKGLLPYLDLVRAVRVGDLNAFHDVINKNSSTFHNDKTFTLIQRLRHNVIKTGLRKINISYSKISLNDIKDKLQLESVEDVEFIVAKAIRDKVINATIDHSKKYLQSKEMIDIYSTEEPQVTFHRRITFCLDTHNDAVKAMRFPPDVHKVNPETAKERREREQELAKNMAEEEEDENAF